MQVWDDFCHHPLELVVDLLWWRITFFFVLNIKCYWLDRTESVCWFMGCCWYLDEKCLFSGCFYFALHILMKNTHILHYGMHFACYVGCVNSTLLSVSPIDMVFAFVHFCMPFLCVTVQFGIKCRIHQNVRLFRVYLTK